MQALEKYFEQFRNQIIGNDACFESPYGTRKYIISTGLPAAGYINH